MPGLHLTRTPCDNFVFDLPYDFPAA